MKKYIGIYLQAAAIGGLCAALPWILAYVHIIAFYDALDTWAIPSAIVALGASLAYLWHRVPDMKPRWIMLALNPAVFYAAFLVWFAIESMRTPWNGFAGLVP